MEEASRLIDHRIAQLPDFHGTMESASRREKSITWRDLAEDFGFESLIQKVDPGSRPG